MRFLERDRIYDGYYRRKSSRYLYKLAIRCLAIFGIAYFLLCLFLYFRQDYLIYQQNPHTVTANPSDADFQLKYQDIWIDVLQSKARIHGWWFDAPDKQKPIIALPNEPINITTVPKTILYLCGRGGSKTHYGSLSRVQGLQQLGFSVLAIDYRGYGLSEGRLPNESRLYQDAEAAWQYLTQKQGISAQNIIIYGESLGGAVGIDLAVKQDEAAGLIVQSSFTSMPEQIKQFRPGLRFFPLNLMVTQRFNSLEKVRSLKIPVLFIHGTKDPIVNYKMSRSLYYAAPEPKTLFYIPEGGHFRIYRSGEYSYLRAIENFLLSLNLSKTE